MAQVNVDITEYDALRDRVKELEELYKESKESCKELLNQLKSQPIDRVILKKSVTYITKEVDWDEMEYYLAEISMHSSYRNYYPLNSDSRRMFIKAFQKATKDVPLQSYDLLGNNKSNTTTYIGFEDVREEVANSFREEIKGQLQTKEEINKELEIKYNATIYDLTKEVEKANKLIEETILENEKDRSALINEYELKLTKFKNEYEQKLIDLKEEYKPQELKLDEALEKYGFKVNKTWWGGLKLKKIESNME